MSIERIAGSNVAASAGGEVKPRVKEGERFSQALDAAQRELTFSAHARSRLQSRNLDMTPEVMGKLEKAVSGAQRKGSRDSLILLRDMAFIVNIPNRTVITAMDGNSMKENVFTNIDSTVIAD
jgi:flagellar operon protein